MSQKTSKHVPEYEELEDERLMARYINGDELAFRELYGRYKSRVYGYLSKQIQDAKVVDDLFQTVFLNAHRSRSSYEEGKLFSAWVFTICRNVVRDYFRSKKRSAPLVGETKTAEQVPAADGVESNRRTWDEILSLISPKQREAVRLRYEKDLDFEEIANQLATSESNVRQMISRAIRKIKGRVR